MSGVFFSSSFPFLSFPFPFLSLQNSKASRAGAAFPSVSPAGSPTKKAIPQQSFPQFPSGRIPSLTNSPAHVYPSTFVPSHQYYQPQPQQPKAQQARQITGGSRKSTGSGADSPSILIPKAQPPTYFSSASTASPPPVKPSYVMPSFGGFGVANSSLHSTSAGPSTVAAGSASSGVPSLYQPSFGPGKHHL